MNETVLLVEAVGDNLNGRLRAKELTGHVETMILEKHGSMTRTWIWRGEWALTGQRVFREELPPSPKEEAETPVFDELKVKQPIQFGVDGQTFGKMVKRYGKK